MHPVWLLAIIPIVGAGPFGAAFVWRLATRHRDFPVLRNAPMWPCMVGAVAFAVIAWLRPDENVWVVVVTWSVLLPGMLAPLGVTEIRPLNRWTPLPLDNEETPMRAHHPP